MKLENYDKFPTELPILRTDSIIYPFMIVPIFIDDKNEIELIKEAHKSGKLLFVTIDNKKNGIGTIGAILREVELPNGRMKILFKGLKKGKLKRLHQIKMIEGLSPFQNHQKNIMKRR